MLRRVTIVVWGVFCLYTAVAASLQFGITFAPSPGQGPASQSAERHGIERVRNVWAPAVFMASGVLALNTAALVALAWRRRFMSEVAEVLMPIDCRLRFVLFGLECALGVPLSAPEAERVFRECEEDQVFAKEYEFYRSRRLRVSGRVDEYEPEAIWLRVEGDRKVAGLLKRVAEGAELHAFRLRAAQGNEDCDPLAR